MTKRSERIQMRTVLLMAVLAREAMAAEPFLVKDINPSGGSVPASLQNVNGTLVFNADDGTNGVELWALTVVGPGDLDGDGLVNLADLAMFQQSFTG